MLRNFSINPWLLLVLLQLFFGASSRAGVTVVSYWRLGEYDPGAASGVTASNTVDVAGSNNLKFQGTARYTNGVAATAANHTHSSLSVNFTSGAYATNAIVSTNVDNFGIECWVKPTALGGGQVIAYNGITGGAGDGGWGLIIAANNTYEGLFGGITAFGTNVAVANVWTHLALVCASGVATLYVNGAVATTITNTPIGPGGNFALASHPQSPAGEFFTGLLDEVRVFTFVPGQFSTNDLLWNQTAIATTLPATAISLTNAQLNGTLYLGGADGTVWFQYGISTSYGSVTPATFVSGTNIAAVSVSNLVNGLSPATTYHFRLANSNATSTIFGGDLSFTTVGPPTISGQSVSSLSPTSAVLNAMVMADGKDTTAWFQYGLTTNYGSSTASTNLSGTNLAAVPVSDLVSQLSAGTAYHFQLVATNILGASYGGDQVFITQTFVQTNIPLPGLYYGSIAWGDFDNDGLMDVLISGATASTIPLTQVWRNTGSGFSNINAGLPATYIGSVAWGDYDNDGRLDILFCGYTGSGVITQVWRNTGSGFTNINAGLPGIEGTVAWGDFDNDGRLDILISGQDSNYNLITQVWRNTGSGFTNINAGLPGIDGSAAWGDYDNDGRLDILLCGYDGSNPNTQVWRNTGNGFTNINAGLPGVDQGTAAWGDYDNDGRLDILLCGLANSGNPITQVWRNTGNGFTNINAGLPGVYQGSAAWGDYDNDGRLDVLLCGETGSGRITQVWRNTGNGFAKIQDLPGLANGAVVTWADFNNDGRLDILASGLLSNDAYVIQLWTNPISPTNSSPTAPTGLSAAAGLGSSFTLSWNASSDLQTPVSGLSYNVRVGTSPGGSDILAPMAMTNGMRLVPQRGSIQRTQVTLQLPSLPPPGKSFYWSVQSIDTSFAGSPFAPEAAAVVPPSFTSSGMTSDGTFEARFNVLSGTNYTIQASTDLVHWVDLLNLTFGSSGPVQFSDPNATNYPQRFYRFGQH